jgi:LDH2 family malate/lactate/ureidoglycolate dehydrogenase
MADYLAALRALPARNGAKVMAPGDREWVVERERSASGIPFDSPTWEAFARHATELEVPALKSLD